MATDDSVQSLPPRRFLDRTVVVIGGGQTPGATVGNGRAAAILYGREGANVLVCDRDSVSAEETAELIRQEGGFASGHLVDVLVEDHLRHVMEHCRAQYGRIDVLHYNVGVSQAAGDAPVTDITADAFSRVMDINVRGMALAAKHALPIMRAQGAGVIINIGSIASRANFPTVAYKTSKAAVTALTEHLAITNAAHGIRVNTVLPGLMDTPMAVEHHIAGGASREDIVAKRVERVPLGGRPGTAWDVARAAVFLASDDAGFVTGASLTVDGGQTLKVG